MTTAPMFAAGNNETELAAYYAAKAQRLVQALITANSLQAAQVIDEVATGQQQTLADIFHYLITPALEKIGDTWCHSEIGIGEEKLATQIVLAEMERLRARFAPPVLPMASPYRVLIAVAAGEQHDIGARMVADLCLTRGWNVKYLGPNVPNGAILNVVQCQQPQVVGLSLTLASGVAVAHEFVTLLAAAAPSVKVVLGGPGTRGPQCRPLLDLPCEIAESAVAGVGRMAELLRANRPKALLKEYQLVLARRVRELRTARGWTQEQLAEATKVTRVCIVAVEGGKQNVSLDILVRLANALNVAPERLLSVEG